MLEFFRGWKRKVGCIILALALVFAAGWVRSRIVGDQVTFHTAPDDRTHGILESGDGSLAAYFGSWPSARVYPKIHSGWMDARIPVQMIDSVTNKPVVITRRQLLFRRVNWRMRFFGFGIGEEINNKTDVWTLCVIPYWSIVLPLTAVSAWLLLSKPCTKSEPRTIATCENA